MPENTKTVANMAKHLTQSELAARREAEAQAMPTRLPKKPPRYIKAKTVERQIWDQVMKDMQGYDILDVLDCDTLGLYCAKLARWRELQDEYQALRKRQREQGGSAFELKTMAAVSAELQSLENGILTYATKLGLTPDGRARLARRIAEQQEQDEYGDLFAP